MTKKLISLLTAAMLVISMVAVALPSVSAAVDENGCYVPSEDIITDVGTNRYYFYMPSEWISDDYKEETSHAGIYWWSGIDACGAVDVYNPDSLKWPGYLAQKGDVEGVFYVDCPIDVTTIIWNNHFNGGEDPDSPTFTLAAQTVNIGAEYYDPGESALYPDGTDSFDNMIYVCDPTHTSTNEVSGQKTYGGEWYYYYGNGQYGTYPTLEEAETAGEVFTGNTHIIDPDSVVIDPEPDPDPDTPDTGEKVIKFDVKNSGWENVKQVWCHIWRADGTGTWPGWQSKKEKCDYNASTGIATYDLSKTGNDIKTFDGKLYCVIFSTNTGMQTYDVIMSGACIGDTLTASTTEVYENPQDSAKSAIPAFWTNNKDCGPAKVVTSSGKVQGTALAEGTTDVTIAADFFISYYADYSKMEKAQSVIDTLNVSPTAVMEVVAAKEAAAVESGSKRQDFVDKEMSYIKKNLSELNDPTAEDIITGDVNGDGTVDISDATMIQKVVAGSTTFTSDQMSAADVDNDGYISVIDVTLIQKYAAGVITEF